MYKNLQIGSLLVKLNSVEPISFDERGWIITTGRNQAEDPVTVYQPRIISTAPGSVRGNHYHPEETETTILLSGLWHLFLADHRGHFSQNYQLDCRINPIKIVIPPQVAHAFINRSNFPALIYHHSDKPYTKNRSIQQIITKGDL